MLAVSIIVANTLKKYDIEHLNPFSTTTFGKIADLQMPLLWVQIIFIALSFKLRIFFIVDVLPT